MSKEEYFRMLSEKDKNKLPTSVTGPASFKKWAKQQSLEREARNVGNAIAHEEIHRGTRKPTRNDVEIVTWQERDRVHVGLVDKRPGNLSLTGGTMP